MDQDHAELHPDPFGPTLQDGGTTFRAWSPRARRMRVILQPETRDERHVELEPIGNGFFGATCPGVTAGHRYLLQRDDERPQPDPASPFQPDGIWGPSEVLDHSAYNWSDKGWRGVAPDDMVLYEIHVGAFSSAGTYEGIRARLGHLTALGINAIKLMPLAAFPGAHNWGYDGVFHLAPFCGYGRPEQLKALVEDCHTRGIAVLLDLVTNHFGPEGNAMWTMARSFFARKNTTPWGPGPRFDHDAVLRYFAQVARSYRRDYHFDGLRIDAFDAVPREHRREHLRTMVQGFAGELPAQAHAMILLESVDNELSLLTRPKSGVTVSQLCFDFQRSAHRLLTGEQHRSYSDYQDPAQELVRCAEDGFSMLERWSQRRGRMIGEAPRPLAWGTIVNYLQNHDTAGNRYRGERLESLIDERTWRAALAYLMLQPAIPYLLMGSEWATQSPFLFFTDFSPALGRRISNNRRRDFEEVDPDSVTNQPPDPQDPAALRQSALDWSEINSKPRCTNALSYTRELIALRRTIRPTMDATTSAVKARANGRSIELRIDRSAEFPQQAYILLANFGDTDVGLPDGERIFTSSPVASNALPPRTTVLVRQDGR